MTLFRLQSRRVRLPARRHRIVAPPFGCVNEGAPRIIAPTCAPTWPPPSASGSRPSLGFGVLAGFAAAYDSFPADLWLAHRLQEIDAPAFSRAVDWAEDLADTPLLIVVWLGATALLVLAGRAQALLLLVSMASRLLNSGLKELIERPRPSPDLLHVSGQSSTFSFPSGHSEAALVLYGLLFYFAALYLPNPWLRLPLQAVCLWVILFIGMERVYGGHHWPSDVLGGFYFGALVAAALIATDRLVTSARQE